MNVITSHTGDTSPSSLTLHSYKPRVWNIPQTHTVLNKSEPERLDVYTQKIPRVFVNRDMSSLCPNTDVINALALALPPKGMESM